MKVPAEELRKQFGRPSLVRLRPIRNMPATENLTDAKICSRY